MCVHTGVHTQAPRETHLQAGVKGCGLWCPRAGQRRPEPGDLWIGGGRRRKPPETFPGLTEMAAAGRGKIMKDDMTILEGEPQRSMADSWDTE